MPASDRGRNRRHDFKPNHGCHHAAGRTSAHRENPAPTEKPTRRLTPGAAWNILWHMKTVTIRQVHHDFSAVLALVAQGEEVTVLNRTRPVARICPPRPVAPAKFKMPDFAARAKAIFGDRIIPNIILEEREASRW